MKEPTPWMIKRTNGYATVVDANRNPIPELADVELGWTDASTGNFVDPEERAEFLASIVRRVNSFEEVFKALEAIVNTCDERPRGVTRNHPDVVDARKLIAMLAQRSPTPTNTEPHVCEHCGSPHGQPVTVEDEDPSCGYGPVIETRCSLYVRREGRMEAKPMPCSKSGARNDS